MSQNGYHPQGMQGYRPANMNNMAAPGGMNPPGYPPVPDGAYRQASVSGYGYPGNAVQQSAQSPQNSYTAGINQNSFQQGYGQEPSGYRNEVQQTGLQNPYMQGYPPAFRQNQQSGSFIPQTPYGPGYPQQGEFPQQNGYPQPGAYPQQTGYSQPGGYPQQNAYSQPGVYPQQPQYNPYTQMGRMQQQAGEQHGYNSASIPLNGGGYVPQKVPVRRQAFELRNWHLILIGAGLIGLFVAGLFPGSLSTVLKILLIILAAGSAVLLWVKPLTAENKRLTFSIFALALCTVTAVSFLFANSGVSTSPGAGQTVIDSGNAGQDGVPEIPPQIASPAAQAPATPEPEDDSLRVRLVSFFSLWHGNRQDEMLALCAPSWQAKQENPRTSLFTLLANRIPQNCTIESTTGTDADTSRKVTLTSKIDRGDGKPMKIYRMTVLMVKENNEWYIDPQSLQTYEAIETPDPNVTETPAPTETPVVYSTTILYYNPKGGEYYHRDPNCRIINSKFTPLAGQFTFAEINDEPYVRLSPCNVCGAPLRP